MSNTNSSLYFERIENYLHSANGIKPLQALEGFVKLDGAPADMIDSVVNGALHDFIFDCVPTPNDFVRIYGPDGKAIYIKKIEMTLNQWTDSLVNTILGVKRERINAILEHMYKKGTLVKNMTNGFVYRGTAPLRRQILTL